LTEKSCSSKGRKKESFRLEKSLSLAFGLVKQQQEVQDAELQIPHSRALSASWWRRGSAEM
jgi:hypothetical protein